MRSTLSSLALGVAMTLSVGSSVAFAGRGGGGYGGGGYGGYHGGGGYGGGGYHGGYGGSSMNSPGYHSTSNGMSQGAKNEAAAGYAGGAASNESAAAHAGSGYSGYGQNANHPAGAAAVGAGYANNHNGGYGGYGGAAAYGGYGRTAGAWNGNYGVAGMGGVGAWGAGSSMYGYGYSGYTNPYNSMAVAGAAPGGQGNVQAQPSSTASYDYAQPINTTAAAQPSTSDQAGALLSQAGDAFRSGDFKTSIPLVQQALALVPNDPNLHQFLALNFFAQGNYDQAAAALYAVLSIGPGWNWSTLIGHYADADLYTLQLRNLEAYTRGNPESAHAAFVLSYHYITEGHADAAAKQLKKVVSLQPADTLSAQLLNKLEPSTSVTSTSPAVIPVPSFDVAKLVGTWNAQAPQGTKVSLSIKDGGGFAWAFSTAGKPTVSVSGSSTVADGVLTLNSPNAQAGVLKGSVTWQDDSHFTFKAIGGPPDDPGLKFAR